MITVQAKQKGWILMICHTVSWTAKYCVKCQPLALKVNTSFSSIAVLPSHWHALIIEKILIIYQCSELCLKSKWPCVNIYRLQVQWFFQKQSYHHNKYCKKWLVKFKEIKLFFRIVTNMDNLFFYFYRKSCSRNFKKHD